MTDETAQDGKLFDTGVNGEVGPEDVSLEVEHGKRFILQAAADENAVVLALIASELQVEIEYIGPDVCHEIVLIALTSHVSPSQLTPVLHPPPFGEDRIHIVGYVAGCIDVGVGRLELLVHQDAVIYFEAGLLSQLDVGTIPTPMQTKSQSNSFPDLVTTEETWSSPRISATISSV